MTNPATKYEQSNTWNEILSEGHVWQQVLRSLQNGTQLDALLTPSKEKRTWLFVGCGTSFYLAQAAAHTWVQLTGLPARALPGSEILLNGELLRAEGDSVQAVVISRSGKTSEAVRAARTLGSTLKIPTIGISCAENSELEKVCDASLVLREADEKSTVMTRSFTSMLLALQALAARRAGNSAFTQGLAEMADAFASQILPIASQMEGFVDSHTFVDYVFLGQGGFHGIAQEAALKVMEMSCSYSQFFHALEFRHGPKAIVSADTCLTFFLSETGYDAEVEVLGEMKELGGAIVAICNRATEKVRRASDLVIELGLAGNDLAMLAPSIVPSQLMGFFTGVGKGLNPDAPKNLTRVVMLD
jgi:glutamine---fructose-6-phosphate transaminase (isomerizing)